MIDDDDVGLDFILHQNVLEMGSRVYFEEVEDV